MAIVHFWSERDAYKPACGRQSALQQDNLTAVHLAVTCRECLVYIDARVVDPLGSTTRQAGKDDPSGTG